MLLSHKIALDPNKNQEIYFAKTAGTARFAYNWALCEWEKQYKTYKQDKNSPKPSWVSLNKQLNEIKHKEYPWMAEVASCIPTQAIMQLNNAFGNFFTKKKGYPRPRKKGIDDRFTLNNQQFRVSDSRIYISKLGWVKMRESLRFDGKIMSATVSRVADRWFVSIAVELKDDPHQQKTENQGVVGVDLGITSLATLSTGEKIKGPKPHTALLKKLRKLSRKLSRKKKGSSNRNKARIKLARLHLRISPIFVMILRIS